MANVDTIQGGGVYAQTGDGGIPFDRYFIEHY